MFKMDIELNYLLLKRLESGAAEIQQIDSQIWEQHGRQLTVLISDMSGFSRFTEKYGILHFLSLIAKRREIVQPIVERYQGRVLKTEADNLYATFEEPINALRASLAIQETLSIFNRERPPSHRIREAHGIACGQVLQFEYDLFGNAMNVASKLAEDLADSRETLLTREVADACKGHPEFEQLEHDLEPKLMEISGIEISYYRLLHT